jgi:hypothetical protein
VFKAVKLFFFYAVASRNSLFHKKRLFGRTAAKEAAKNERKNNFQLILKLSRGGMSLSIFIFLFGPSPSRRAMCL